MCDKTKNKSKAYEEAKEDFRRSKDELSEAVEKGNELCHFINKILKINFTPASGK